MVSRNALRAIGVVVVGATLAACSSSGPGLSFKQRAKEFFSESSYGKASPRVVSYGPVPKGGGHIVVGSTYRVAGKTYVPSPNPRYSETGLASWYGAAFHGRLTANGEVYDVNGLTAAHPTLPLPSYARVTNLENGRSMIVRINDRGPFAHDRIIDLSSHVADMLDMKNEGTARVQVDYIGPARMDGLDQRKLLASYKGPSQDNSLFAWAKPKVQDAQVVFAAAAAPIPRERPVLGTYPPKIAGAVQPPLALMPAYAPSDDDDPLAPLIMRSSFVSSYAAGAKLSAAQNAANDLASSRLPQPDLKSALARAAAKKALQLGVAPTVVGAMDSGAIVQLGSFVDPANAERVARAFEQYGKIDRSPLQSGDRTLTVVRVAVTSTASSAEVLNAATSAGLSGAFVLGR